MTLMHFDFLKINTDLRLAGVRSLWDFFYKALPEFRQREREVLERRAEKGNWEYADYEVERQLLNDKFKHWLPRFATYSVIILLHAVLESQLNACADRVQKRSHSPLKLSDIKDGGIDAAALYLKRLMVFEVKQDDEWNTLSDLRDLRNIIAHRMGSKGHPDKHHEKINCLSKKYPGDLKFLDDFCENEMYISMSLCRRFTDAVERVLNRVIKAVNAAPVEPESSPSEKCSASRSRAGERPAPHGKDCAPTDRSEKFPTDATEALLR